VLVGQKAYTWLWYSR